jgi:hypothetical protein
MGGGGFIGERPAGASSWCKGDDVIKNLNDVFFDPASSNGEYQAARPAAPLFGQVQNISGNWQNLLAAYTDAFDLAGGSICPGWPTYLRALGELGVNIVTTSSTSTTSDVLVFGTTTAAIPVWMKTGLMVYDFSTPGAITAGQTVTGINTPSAGQIRISANVNATVNSGDTIVFSAYGGGNAVTTSLTNTPSPVLTFGPGNVPSWMAKGLNVYDASNPGAITGGQTVLDFDNKTVTLTTGVNATVHSGDTIVFSVPPGQGQLNIYNIAQARYECLTANVGMTTSKHDPHDAKKHGHGVKRSGIIVTTSPTNTSGLVLTFGAGNIPSWMDVGMNVFDASTPGAITGGQTVTGINTPSAGQIRISANVNATVNSGDTIVFSVPPVVGSITIDSPYIPPGAALSRRGLGPTREP